MKSLARGGSDDEQVQSTPVLAATAGRVGSPSRLGAGSSLARTSGWSSVMATAVMASIPAIVLLVVAQRYVAAGVTAGAVK